MFLLMSAMVDSVVTSAAELMILPIKYWIKNERLRAVEEEIWYNYMQIMQYC